MVTCTAKYRTMDETKSAPSGALTPTGGLTECLWLERTRLMSDSIRSSSPETIPRTAPKSRSIEEMVREGFYKSVDRSGDCWIWTKTKNNWGYGVARIMALNMTAHRLSWAIEHGPIPDGMLVLHKCDDRACVRPDHLFLGTSQDNSDDMMRKGRNRNTVLTQDDVLEMRRRYASGGTSTIKLAREFGVGVTTIANIIHRRTWGWLDDQAVR